MLSGSCSEDGPASSKQGSAARALLSPVLPFALEKRFHFVAEILPESNREQLQEKLIEAFDCFFQSSYSQLFPDQLLIRVLGACFRGALDRPYVCSNSPISRISESISCMS